MSSAILRRLLPASELDRTRREEIIAALNQDLTCTISLAISAKQAHWNVEGPNFQGLHELFDVIAAEAREWSDLLAERLVTLGGTAHATVEDLSASGLDRFPRDERRWDSLTGSLHDHLLSAAESMRRHARDMQDEMATQDIYVEILRTLEKRAWMLRAHLEEHGVVVSTVAEGKEDAGAKFRDYFAYSEPYARVAAHRALALFRGRNEDVLRVSLKLPEDVAAGDALARPFNACERRIAAAKGIADQGRKADAWLLQTARWTWSVKLAWQLEMDLFTALRERAEAEAIRVFAANLHDLLLAAPAGPRVTMGLDPGLRTGVKVAVVDRTGKLLETATVYPHVPRNDWDGALHTLGQIARRHGVELVSIGNGTASRETDRLAAELVQRLPELRLTKIVVSEAGASVYSASELASREFPQLDVSLRGAVSIARRLQDPLAELVKIEPKSIGVGQYQHDVSQVKLAKQLDAVVEDCVNAVGVDVNTASAPLLARISGLSGLLAENIVLHRDAHGPFRTREQLKAVPRLGPKTFEQAAGFLRIPAGDNPLDASSVHPEAYPVVERILADLRRPLGELMRDGATLKRIDPARYTDGRFGEPTVRDILKELEKPGRDPRPEFRTATFRDGIEELEQLQPSMILEGVVTNVTAFGAFVDVGVHQDGLVHISVMANRYVRDPREVVKAGDIVKVKVLEVDVKRRRIALSMRLDEPAAPRVAAATGGERDDPRARTGARGRGRDVARETPRRTEPSDGGVMADALKRALQGR